MREPKDLLYSRSHEWVDMLEDGSAYVGISDYAQSELGDIVFVNLPEPDDEITAGESFADIYSPVTGTVAEVNEELLDSPELLNSAPYESWLVKVTDITDKEELLTEGEYDRFVESLKDK